MALTEKGKRAGKTTRAQYQIYLDELQTNNFFRESKFDASDPDILKRTWEELSVKLNASGGPIREVAGWKRVFTDWRSPVRGKARKIKCAMVETGNAGDPPKPLTDLEERLREITGKVVVDGMSGVPEIGLDYTTPTLRMTSQAVPKQHAPIQVFKVDIKGQNSVLTPVNVGLEDIKQMTPIPGPFATTTSLFRLQEFARTFYSEQNNFPNDDIKMNELKSSSSHITEKATVQTKGPVLEQPNRVPPGIHQGCVNELFTPPNPPLDQKTPNGASISINTFISKSILRKHILDRKKATQIPGFSQSETLRKLHKIKSLQRQVVVKVTKSLEVKV